MMENMQRSRGPTAEAFTTPVIILTLYDLISFKVQE